MINAVGDGKSPRYPIRDWDGVYGLAFRDRVKALDNSGVHSATCTEVEN